MHLNLLKVVMKAVFLCQGLSLTFTMSLSNAFPANVEAQSLQKHGIYYTSTSVVERSKKHEASLSAMHADSVTTKKIRYHVLNQTKATENENKIVKRLDDEAEYSEDKKKRKDNDTSGIILMPIHFSRVKYPLVFSIVVILAGLSKLGFHYSHFLSSKIPESCMLVVIGVLFGVLFHFTDLKDTLTLFSPQEFFIYLLPPIIMEAAFSLHDRAFAENIGSVLLFAILGTVINCFLIGFTLFGLYRIGVMEEINCTFVELLVFSSLIVAVDPVAVLAVFQEVGVNNTLYFLVLGESLLNDGVTVVLYNVMQIVNSLPEINAAQIFLGIAKFFIVVGFGLTFGIICGLVSSFITKFTYTVKVVEPLIIFGFAYLSYVLSEMFQFSGILSMIACGIIQVHYAFHNITRKSRLTVKFFAKVMATASEIIIFLFLGLVTVADTHIWKTGFTVWTLLFCVVYRFITTYCLSFLINIFSEGRGRKIGPDEMFMISYAGLRGAVCFALVALISEKEIPAKHMFVTTTIFIIFFTVFVQGGTIKFLVKGMRVKLEEASGDMILNEQLSKHVIDHLMAGVEEILGYTTGTHYIKERMDHIDDTVVRPWFLRNAIKSEMDEISKYYEKLVMKEHFKNLQINGARLPRVKTEIRHLDSALALDKLKDDDDDDDDNETQERQDERVSHRNRDHLEDNKVYGYNIHKFLSHAVRTVRSRLHIYIHDDNIVHDRKHKFVSELRLKYRKNRILRDLRRTNEDGNQKIQLPVSLSYQFDGTLIEEGKSRRLNIHDNVIGNDENKTYANKNDDGESDLTNGKVTFSL